MRRSRGHDSRIRFAGQRGALIAPPLGILIACGNERGNIEKAILRMPRFGRAQEILFVGGYSADFEECERVATATGVCPEQDKGHAVREEHHPNRDDYRHA